jgi:hypothetical protein
LSDFADAVPKKRGPKTDVLEALLKRVDGLEQKLKEKKTDPNTPTSENRPTLAPDDASSNGENSSSSAMDVGSDFPTVDTSRTGAGLDESAIYSPTSLGSVWCR